MSSTKEKLGNISNKVIKSLKSNLSTLVGHDILILSEQFENCPLYSKVILVNDNVISLDRGGADGKIDELNNDQEVLIQFDYKGQRLSVKATLYRTIGGRCNIVLGDSIVPLNRRMFKRYNEPYQVRCAVLPMQHIECSKLSKMRWMQTESINISCGGILLPLPTHLANHTFLLLNIDISKIPFPNLVVGQVRYAQTGTSYNFNAGIQFIVNEEKEKYFPTLTLKRFPSEAFEYTIKERTKFDKILSVEIPDKQE